MDSLLKIQPHQKIAVEYIVSKEPNQHGIVFNHHMGTGKSLTAAFLFKNYPNDKKILIIPSGLENQWLKELERVGLFKNDIKIINYDEMIKIFNPISSNEEKIKFLKELEKSILVIDESHIFIDILYSIFDDSYNIVFNSNKPEDNKKESVFKPQKKFNLFLEIINYFKKIKKLIFMSGTIDMYDVNFYINLCSGKILVNWYPNYFVEEFKKTNILTKRFLEVMAFIIKKNPFGIFSTDFQGSIMQIIGGINKKDFLKKSRLAQRINLDQINFVSFFQSGIYTRSENEIIKLLDYTIEKEEKNSVIIQALTNNKLNNILYWYNLSEQEKTEFFDHFLNLKQKFSETEIKTESRSFLISSILSAILFFNIPSILLTKLKKMYIKHIDFERLDYKKLKNKNLDKYFSFYKYLENIDFYPTFEIINKRVEFTNEQLILMSKILIGVSISPQDFYELEYVDTIEEAEVFTHKIHYTQKNNLAIGNMYEEPNKFKQILEIYKKDPISTIIWSNFYKSGLLKIANYLKKNKIKFEIFEPSISDSKKNKILKDFKDKKINLILLHPDYYQGFSIQGCRHFHILEPIKNIKKRNQLMTRTIRFKSHSHLPENERNVKIYQWSCSLGKDIKSLLNQTKYFNKFLKTYYTNLYLDKSFEEFLSLFYNFISIDDKYLTENEDRDKEIEYFEKTIKEISIDDNKLQNTCCIYGVKDCDNLLPCYEKK